MQRALQNLKNMAYNLDSQTFKSEEENSDCLTTSALDWILEIHLAAAGSSTAFKMLLLLQTDLGNKMLQT